MRDYTCAPRLLALESAAAECSAALLIGAECRVRRAATGTRHGDCMLELIDALLADGGIRLETLDAVAFGRGPGSFTGQRIAVGTAQGIALGAGLPVIPVSSLAALAQGAQAPRVLTALDARMGEVYWGVFQKEGRILRPVEAECLTSPGRIPLPAGDGWHGVGSGFGVHGEALRARLGSRLAVVRPELHPGAAAVADLAAEYYRRGEHLDAAHALPTYLRPAVASRAPEDTRSDPATGRTPRE